MKRRVSYLLTLAIAGVGLLAAQTEANHLENVLKEEVLPPDVALFQLRQYILDRVRDVPALSTAAQWTAESKHIRDQIMTNVVYHGWPKEWVDAEPKFEDLGETPGNGYVILRRDGSLSAFGDAPNLGNAYGRVGAAAIGVAGRLKPL